MTATTELMTADQLVQIERDRRSLQTSLADAIDDRARIQASLQALGGKLEDPTVPAQISKLQRELLRATSTVVAHEKALQRFERDHPTAEQIAEQQQALGQEKALAARAAARKPFLDNRARALQLIEELQALDQDAMRIVAHAEIGLFANGTEAMSLSNMLDNYHRYAAGGNGLERIRQALVRI